jgi:uncharacterized protein (DUF952 family)
MDETLVFKILTRQQWDAAQAEGIFRGAPIDVQDGYIHFSTAGQARETAAKHFAGQNGLLLAAVIAAALGDRLVYEVSRGGALFPHLYGPLHLSHVLWVKPLSVGANGLHEFPDMSA